MDRPDFAPRCPDHAERVRASFARQRIMATLGARLTEVVPGRVTITMPFDPAFAQQHGFLHAGAVSTLLDSACGYAGYSLMDADSAVLTAEFKINLLAPAEGALFEAVGRVTKPGRMLVFAEGQMHSHGEGRAPRLIATMSCTLAAVRDRGLTG